MNNKGITQIYLLILFVFLVVIFLIYRDHFLQVLNNDGPNSSENSQNTDFKRDTFKVSKNNTYRLPGKIAFIHKEPGKTTSGLGILDFKSGIKALEKSPSDNYSISELATSTKTIEVVTIFNTQDKVFVPVYKEKQVLDHSGIQLFKIPDDLGSGKIEKETLVYDGQNSLPGTWRQSLSWFSVNNQIIYWKLPRVGYKVDEGLPSNELIMFNPSLKQEKVVYSHPFPGSSGESVVETSLDGTHLLFTKLNSESRWELLIFDLKNFRSEPVINPTDHQIVALGQGENAAWLSNDEILVNLPDLSLLNLKTKQVKTIINRWTNGKLSPDRKTLAYNVSGGVDLVDISKGEKWPVGDKNYTVWADQEFIKNNPNVLKLPDKYSANNFQLSGDPWSPDSMYLAVTITQNLSANSKSQILILDVLNRTWLDIPELQDASNPSWLPSKN